MGQVPDTAEIDGGTVHVIVVNPDEYEAHVKNVAALTGVMRDLLLAAADVPPFSMMITPEQKRMLKQL